MEIVAKDDRIHINVEDWGTGFDPSNVKETCFGLQGIYERARLLDGRVIIDTTPTTGTRIRVELPCALAPQSEGASVPRDA